MKDNAGIKRNVVPANMDVEDQTCGERDWKIELVLFCWVSGAAVIFNIYYWSTY